MVGCIPGCGTHGYGGLTVWTAFGDSQSRPFLMMELSEEDSRRSGQTWRKRRRRFRRTISLNNHSKQGGSFPPEAYLAPVSSSGQTSVCAPGDSTISSELFCKVSLWKDTKHCAVTFGSSLLSRGAAPVNVLGCAVDVLHEGPHLGMSGPSVFWASRKAT